MSQKTLYPLLLSDNLHTKVWGGTRIKPMKGLAPDSERIGESWECSAVPGSESIVENGIFAGRTLNSLVEEYGEKLLGKKVFKMYGAKFPLLIKFIDAEHDLSIQVHPDNKMAKEYHDSFGKTEMWYVMDAKPGAKIYSGFTREITAQEFYDRCRNCTIDQVLNVIEPKKGDVLFITPGTVHAADGGLLIAEIQESSDMTFRLYDWGREFNPATARKMHIEEAIDVIDYRPFDFSNYKRAHEHDHEMIESLVECPQFNVSKINLTDPLHIYTEKFGSFIVYICLEGAASIQVPSTKENGEAYMENYEFAKGETILIPADLPDFFLVPRDSSTKLLEAVTRPEDAVDAYIDPETEAFLENEDYEGLEDGAFDDDEPQTPAGASPLNFFN